MRLKAISTAVLVFAAFVVSACGSAQTAKTVTVTAAGATATTTSPAPTQARKRESTKPRPSTMKACDANIRVRRSTTSCAFGENVFYGFWKAQDQGDDAFSAYSPVTQSSYAMACTVATKVVCRAGDGGEVRFPMAAIRAYTAEQAARYAASHDTGPDDVPDSGADQGSPPSSSGSGGDDCDPSYEGACLDPNSPDYDCEGGSGDGPDYTGPVTVVGDDHFGLDRDGDGQACE
jgi:hypothetical protein